MQNVVVVVFCRTQERSFRSLPHNLSLSLFHSLSYFLSRLLLLAWDYFLKPICPSSVPLRPFYPEKYLFVYKTIDDNGYIR